MTQVRKQRLKEARVWFFQQHFTEKSHVVKAYRVRFGVDRECAMRELCILKLISPEKQEMYEKQLAEKERKRAEKREERKAQKARKEMPEFCDNPDQDGNFLFIAGYTSGGAPYGITWEEEAEIVRNEGIIADEVPFDEV